MALKQIQKARESAGGGKKRLIQLMKYKGGHGACRVLRLSAG
jgi:streptomycin 6-kinase